MFPFVAVEGQEKVKKALYLSLINKKIGGVLISGEKGTAKSTLVRGLDEIIEDKKIINLPLNITEDNLVGTLDIEKTLKIGKKVFQEGLLKKSHNNILYVDEINLLGENIVSTLLEVMALKENYIERDGLSISHPTDFLLIGTMNPEEGELREQFLDKFGIFVKIEGIKKISTRVRIIKQRLEYERNPEKFRLNYEESSKLLKEKIQKAQELILKIKVSEQILRLAIKIVEEAHTVGNRAEIILVETAKAIAAFEGRIYLNIEDLKEAAEFVLPHRIRKVEEEKENNFQEEPNVDNQDDKKNENKDENIDDNRNSEEKEEPEIEKNEKCGSESELEESSQENSKPDENFEENYNIGKIFKVKEIIDTRMFDHKKRKGIGKRCKTKTSLLKGRYVKSIRPRGKILDLAFDATIRAAAPYQKLDQEEGLKIKISKEHIRVKVREHRTGTTIVFVVDSSGSMGVKKRMEAVKGTIMSLLKDAYEKRDKVGMISFRRDRAEEVLPITRSIDLAQKKLKNLVTGGKTPLVEGLLKGYSVLKREMKLDKDILPIMVILSDGKGNFSKKGEDPIKESIKVARNMSNEKIKIIVVDTEEGFVKLELAKKLAEALAGEYYRLENLKSDDLLTIVKDKI